MDLAAALTRSEEPAVFLPDLAAALTRSEILALANQVSAQLDLEALLKSEASHMAKAWSVAWQVTQPVSEDLVAKAQGQLQADLVAHRTLVAWARWAVPPPSAASASDKFSVRWPAP